MAERYIRKPRIFINDVAWDDVVAWYKAHRFNAVASDLGEITRAWKPDALLARLRDYDNNRSGISSTVPR